MTLARALDPHMPPAMKRAVVASVRHPASSPIRLAQLAVKLAPKYPAAAAMVATRLKQQVGPARAATPAAPSSPALPQTAQSAQAAADLDAAPLEQLDDGPEQLDDSNGSEEGDTSPDPDPLDDPGPGDAPAGDDTGDGVGAAPSVPSSLASGKTLGVNQSIASPNGRYKLLMQGDGNLVIYEGTRAFWDIGKSAGRRAVMQTDGNLVCYSDANKATWASNTKGKTGGVLKLQDDGNLCIYVGSKAVWASRTQGGKRPPKGGLINNIAHGITSVTKVVTNNPVWSAVAAGVSFVPGIGTAVSAGMSVAAAAGRGASLANIALAAAKGAIPGGPVAGFAFDAAVGLVHGKKVDAVAIATARAAVPGGAPALLAFDTGITLSLHADVAGPALAAAQKALAAQHPPAVVAKVFSTFTTTRTTQAVVDGVRKREPGAIKAAALIGAAAAKGNDKAIAAAAQMKVIADIRARQLAAAPAAVQALPAPVRTPAPAVALAVAPTAKLSLFARHRAEYLRGTSALGRARTSRATVARWHGVVKTAS